MNNAYGDFQTPLDLTAQIVKRVLAGKRYDAIVEPTCGTGVFLEAAVEAWPEAKLLGVEINPNHAHAAKSRVPRAEVVVANTFDYAWYRIDGNNILILGNPPWITNSEQSARLWNNLPKKSNLLGLKGLDVLIGASNFDVSEYLTTRLVLALRGKNVDFLPALQSESRKKSDRAFQKIRFRSLRRPLLSNRCEKKHFNASVEAVCFYFSLSPGEDSIRFFQVWKRKYRKKSTRTKIEDWSKRTGVTPVSGIWTGAVRTYGDRASNTTYRKSWNWKIATASISTAFANGWT